MWCKTKRVRTFHLKWIAALTVLVLLVASMPVAPLTAVAANQSYQQKLDALEQENERLEAEIADAKAKQEDEAVEQAAIAEQIENVLAQMDVIGEQIASYESEITVINNQISEYDQNISSLTDKIADMEIQVTQKEKDIEKNYDLFKKRMRSLYMTGEVSTLTILFNSEDFADYLLKSKMTEEVAKHDQELIDTLNNDITELNNSKAEIEATKSDLEAERAKAVESREASQAKLDEISASEAELTARKTELETLQQESNSLSSSLSQQINAALQKRNNNDAEIDRIISGYYEQNPGDSSSGSSSNSSSGSSSGGSSSSSSGFLWPVPGYYNLSSPFGPRWGSVHGGVDISSSGINGQDIVASMGGTVITAVWGTTGYGRYVIIDHGYINGHRYATLYGHCSSLLVSTGQQVSQGQVIAKVGSTGNSTGPHLHFEIRVDNQKVDPMNYF